jgi:hypothetical protein
MFGKSTSLTPWSIWPGEKWLWAAPGDAGHDLVTFGYLVLDNASNFREGSVLLIHLLLVALTARLLAGKQAMIDEVRGEQFV